MRYKLTVRLLEEDKAFFGPGVVQLAEHVEKGMSLRQAALAMGMAYSKAWRIVTEFQTATGFPLIECQRGGLGGGGSVLTTEGKRLLDGYRDFIKKATDQCDRLYNECLVECMPRR